MAERDINTSTVALIGFIGALIVFAIIVLLQVVYFRWVSAREAKDRQVPPSEWSRVRTEQEARLNVPVPPQGTEAGSLPISAAMDVVIKDLHAGKPIREVSGRATGATAPPTAGASGETAPNDAAAPAAPAEQANSAQDGTEGTALPGGS